MSYYDQVPGPWQPDGPDDPWGVVKSICRALIWVFVLIGLALLVDRVFGQPQPSMAATAATTVDYDRQIRNQPQFPRQLWVQVLGGPKVYQGDPSKLQVAVVLPGDGPVLPGACNSADAVNLPLRLRQMGAPSMIVDIAGKAVYVCAPATGSGGRLLRIDGRTEW